MMVCTRLRVRFASEKEHKVWGARARHEAGRALQLDPDLAEAHVALAAVHRFQEYDWDTVIRESRRAEALLESMIDDEGPLPGNARATLAAIRAAQGASSEARALAERVASEPELIHHGAYGLGTTYAQLNDPTSAIRWLSQAATTGFPCYPWYERDALLDPIRDDPRFVGFMRELRGSWEAARAKYASISHAAMSMAVLPER